MERNLLLASWDGVTQTRGNFKIHKDVVLNFTEDVLLTLCKHILLSRLENVKTMALPHICSKTYISYISTLSCTLHEHSSTKSWLEMRVPAS